MRTVEYYQGEMWIVHDDGTRTRAASKEPGEKARKAPATATPPDNVVQLRTSTTSESVNTTPSSELLGMGPDGVRRYASNRLDSAIKRREALKAELKQLQQDIRQWRKLAASNRS